MAGLRFRATTAEVALTASTAKTVLQIVAAANHRVLVPRFSVSFEGVAPTDAPVLVDIVIQTDAGTSSALTPAKDNPGDDETLQVTARHTATVEPTTTTTLESRFVHPQGSRDFGPFVVPGGTRLGVRCNAPNNVGCIVSAMGEE